ncbi:hypothetical protein Patl1_21083 [Pistacia atlantica]|uniref:Uncharacterized protein n=1 Tax=Pistacia atlantica TaxID=434234 RepID=A0ACC1BJ93_9ROSI|nr:hypothetical protein Patl1_21083 [Pistacia atlantica]
MMLSGAQASYLCAITEIKKPIEESCHQNVAASSSNTGLTQTANAGKSSSLQNVSWVSRDRAGALIEQGIQPKYLCYNPEGYPWKSAITE